MLVYETKVVKNKPLRIKRRENKKAISPTFKRLQLNGKKSKTYFFFILADVFSITFQKNPKLFILRGKKSLIGYYCTYFIYFFFFKEQ